MYVSAEQNHKDNFWEVLVDIDESYSRKNYDKKDLEDPYDEHWTWWSGREEDIQFQAINCHVCGEYQISHTVNSPQCMCEKNNIIDNQQVSFTKITNPFTKTYSWISIGDTEYDNKYM